MATLENTAAPRRDARAGGALDAETQRQVAELNLRGIEVIQAGLAACGVVAAAVDPPESGAAGGGPACRRAERRRRPGALRGGAPGSGVGGPSGSPTGGPSGGTWAARTGGAAGVGRARTARVMAARAGLAVTLAVPGREAAQLPDAIELPAADWLALDAGAHERLAACPYLLFELDVAGLLAAVSVPPQAVQEARGLPGEPAVAPPFGSAEGRGFARLLVHYAWHLARSSPTVAAFVFGTPQSVLEPLRTLGLARVETLAAAAGSALRLRWDREPMIWMDWLYAARTGEPAALWAAQLRGLQRIAGECREAARST